MNRSALRSPGDSNGTMPTSTRSGELLDGSANGDGEATVKGP